jgi:hypothetical protein
MTAGPFRRRQGPAGASHAFPSLTLGARPAYHRNIKLKR